MHYLAMEIGNINKSSRTTHREALTSPLAIMNP
jgi:hypothetical protein